MKTKILLLIVLSVLCGTACNWIGYDDQDSAGRWWKHMFHNSDGQEKGKLRYKVGSTNHFDLIVVRQSQLVNGCVKDYLETLWCVGQPSPLKDQAGNPLPVQVVNY